MQLHLQFTYNNQPCICEVLLDSSALPYYMFTLHTNPYIIAKYSDEVVIKTDLLKVLPKEDDYIDGIVELRQTIFNAFTATTEYEQTRSRLPKVSGASAST